MKNSKRMILIIVIIAILLILILGGIFIYNKYIDKNYKIENVDQYSYFILYEDEKYGVIDSEGKIVVEPKYEMLVIPNPSKDVFVGYTNYNSQEEYKTEIINSKNEKVLTKYEKIEPLIFKDATTEVPYEKSVLMYKENNKYGIIDFKGKKITNAIYDSIESLLYKEGCLLVKKEDKYGVINIRGKQMVEIKYDSITADGYYDESTKYQKAGFIVGNKTVDGYKYGYINSNGSQILKEEYNEIERVTEIEDEVYILAFKNGQAGIYNSKKQILKHIYEEIEYNKENELFIVQKSSKQGVYNKEGKEILKPEYDNIIISNKSIYAEKDQEKYFFDEKGNKQEEQKYKIIYSEENSKYRITMNEEDKFGIIDENGNNILNNEYSYIEHIFKDYYIINENGKTSVYDANTKKQIISNYSVIQKIENKNMIQAIITEPYTIELYNDNMEKVAQMKNAKLTIEKEYVKLESQTQREYFDKNANKIQAKNIFTNSNLFAFSENGKWGYKDKEEKVIIAPIYDSATELNTQGFAGIRKDNKWGVINKEGKIILEPTYELSWDEPEFIGEYCKLNFGYGMVYYTRQVNN